MSGKWETGSKMKVAKRMLMNILDSLKKVDNVEIALRVYGHQSYVPPQDCNDTKLEVPFEPNNIEKIKHKLRQVEPRGTTPIAHSLNLAGNDFPKSKGRNIIILITDGIEACDGDPCEVSRALQKRGVILKPFVIGIGLNVNLKKTFECVGQYYDASNEKEFTDVLNVVISQALNNTTAQVNLLDINHKPTESNVNMTFYNHKSGAVVYNYIHTMNAYGVPDTLVFDPFTTFDMVVHTIPPVTVKSIKMTVGKHLIIPAYVPQGSLIIKSKDNSVKPKIVIKQRGKKNIINVQDINKSERYLVGKYELEILTLPRIIVGDLSITPNHQTKIDIPTSGLATISRRFKGYGSIYIKRGDELEWVYNLDLNKQQDAIYLLPGKYIVVYRNKGINETIKTKTRNFSIISGRSTLVKIDY